MGFSRSAATSVLLLLLGGCAGVTADPALAPTCASLQAESSGQSSKPRLRDPVQASRVVDRVYPLAARRSGITGAAVVKALVNVEGHVQQVELVRTSGHWMLDQAAVDAARQFLFRPALDDGCRVDAWVQMPVRFRVRRPPRA